MISTYRTSLSVVMILVLLSVASAQESKAPQSSQPEKLPEREAPLKHRKGLQIPKVSGRKIKSVEKALVRLPGAPPGQPGVLSVVVQGILDATDEWVIGVYAGENYAIVAGTDDPQCNGWTFTPTVGLFGPEGFGWALPPAINNPDARYIDPNNRPGALIASITDRIQ